MRKEWWSFSCERRSDAIVFLPIPPPSIPKPLEKGKENPISIPSTLLAINQAAFASRTEISASLRLNQGSGDSGVIDEIVVEW